MFTKARAFTARSCLMIGSNSPHIIDSRLKRCVVNKDKNLISFKSCRLDFSAFDLKF